MGLSLRFIILSGFLLVLLPALILLSYTDFTKAKSDLEDNFDFMVEQTAENITGAYDLVEVGFRILSLSLEDTMKKERVSVLGAEEHTYSLEISGAK